FQRRKAQGFEAMRQQSLVDDADTHAVGLDPDAAHRLAGDFHAISIAQACPRRAPPAISAREDRPMPPIDTEAEYNNRARVPEHAAIFQLWQKEAAAYREEAEREKRAELGLAYGLSPRQILDIFEAKG